MENFFAFHANDLVATKLNLDGYPSPYFRPHGLYFYKDKTNGKKFLYVVNHRPEEDTVEIFEVIKPTQIKYVQTIQSPVFLNINDLYVDNNGDVYISSFTSYEPDTFMDQIEKYFRMPWNKVIVCIPQSNTYQCKIALEGLSMPNGVIGYKDELYVVETLKLQVKVFKKSEDKKLTLNRTIPTASGCDNANLDEDGNIYMGCHQKMLTFVSHSKNHKVLSPSQVLRIKRDANNVEEIFLSHGDDLSGSSSALWYKEKLYIGSVFDEGVLVCEGIKK